MIRIILILSSLMVLSFSKAYSQDGKIIKREQLDIFQNKKLANRISYKKNGKRFLKPKYTYLDSVVIQKITYLSDGLKVNGYLAFPKIKKQYPCVIYNRGGNREFGSLNEFKAVFILARVASWGHVVAASQYRGNGGSEGKEEFGGAEVNDVLNLVPFLGNVENTDTSRIALYGWSRGGMMTYLALTRTCRFKAAIVGGGLSDLWAVMETRTDTFETVFAENIPDYARNTKAALNARSAIRQVDKICKTTPILMLHGTADWRVVPEMALDLSKAFIKANVPHRLVMFEGGDHGLRAFNDEVDAMTKNWLRKYLKKMDD
ncbi:MAG TPA: S9 family peptidase [Phaeodactylibacter sp.]|nr:S9 family peptidase [Phaeodactylibacter sp.]